MAEVDPVRESTGSKGAQAIYCKKCGNYGFEKDCEGRLGRLSEKETCSVHRLIYEAKKLGKLAFITRYPQEDTNTDHSNFLRVSIHDVFDIYALPPLVERFDKVLVLLSEISKFYGDEIDFYKSSIPPLFSQNSLEFKYIRDHLSSEGFITPGIVGDPDTCRLTPKGWQRAYDFERGADEKNLKQAFVAMWISEEMDRIYTDGFAPAIKAAGFTPLIITQKEHNNDITDEIIAEIKRSRFLVADMTGQRGGVYYEAGFMRGLGRPVIHTCKSAEKDRVHFDTRNLNYIFWDSALDLKEKLLNRIRASILQ